MSSSMSNSNTTSTYSQSTSPSRDSEIRRNNQQRILNTPQLYSKADQLGIHQARCNLQIEVASLKKRKEMLIEQHNQVRKNMVSIGELEQMKANIRSNLSTTQSIQLSDLMNEYSEVIRENCNLVATCDIIQKMIAKETKNRENEIEKAKKFAECVDFTSFLYSLPQISNGNVENDSKKNNIMKTEIAQLQHKLDGIRKEMMSCDIIVPPSTMFCEAAATFTRKTETEWQIRSLGAAQLREQIKNLQKQVVESNSYLKKTEDKIMDDRAKLSLLQVTSSENESKTNAKCDMNLMRFKSEMLEIDQNIQQLQRNISVSAETYEKIMKEIQKLETQNTGKDENIDYDDSEEDKIEYLISKYAQETGDKIISSDMIKKKVELEKEVQKLSEKYKKEKKYIKRKEAMMLKQINSLTNRYSSNKQILEKQKIEYFKGKESKLEKEMNKIIDNINNSIVQLRSEYT